MSLEEHSPLLTGFTLQKFLFKQLEIALYKFIIPACPSFFYQFPGQAQSKTKGSITYQGGEAESK